MTVFRELMGFTDRVNDRAKEIPPGIIGGLSAALETRETPHGLDYRVTITIEPISEFAEVIAATATFTVAEAFITNLVVENEGVMEPLPELPNDEGGTAELMFILRDWVQTACPDLHLDGG